MIKYCKACKYYIPQDAIKCAHCRTDQRTVFRHLFTGANLGILITAVMAGCILFQSIKIKEQTDSIGAQTRITKDNFILQNRPYLYVDIKPVVSGYDKDNNFFAGAEIVYRNEGLFAASEIETEAKIADDGDGDRLFDIINWYMDEYGSYPYVKNVFPKQMIWRFPFKANISDFPETNEKYIYFGIRIKYKGFTNDIYCYGADYIYKIIKHEQDKFSIIVLKYDTYWDMNKSLSMDEIKVPDWNIFKKNKK